MKKIIELIPNTKVEINTDKNGKSVILYSDNSNNEEEESKFKNGDFISAPYAIAIYKNKNIDCDGFNLYASICNYTSIVSYSVMGYNMDKWGLASDYEIQKLKEALKNKGYYWDKEEKEIREIGKFNEGDYAIFKSENKLYKGIITDIRKAVYTRYNIFVPLENIFFCGVDKYECFHPTAVDIEEIEFQMLKIGKKWDGEKIVDIIWKPKEGEEYYYINAEGETCGDKYDGNIKWIDEQRFDFGNCFKTGEEAVSYRDKIKELLTKRK